VAATAVRDLKQLHVRLQDLERLEAALAGWQLEIDSAVQDLITATTRRRESLLRAREVVEAVQRPGVAEELLHDFEERRQLDKHQVKAVAAITHPDVTGICLFDEQGLGKTVMTLFSFHRLRLRDEVACMLVLAPKNMVLEWARDTERFFGKKYLVEVVV